MVYFVKNTLWEFLPGPKHNIKSRAKAVFWLKIRDRKATLSRAKSRNIPDFGRKSGVEHRRDMGRAEPKLTLFCLKKSNKMPSIVKS